MASFTVRYPAETSEYVGEPNIFRTPTPVCGWQCPLYPLGVVGINLTASGQLIESSLLPPAS
jgi:hypothetical protein